MKVFDQNQKILSTVSNWKSKQLSIGFVPTMGALHQGHISLIKQSIKENDKTVVSIFVNPTQFGPNEDFSNYPRTLQADLDICNSLDVDLVFSPSESSMYPDGKDSATQVYVPRLSKKYCGKSRPNFFQGVCSIVLRLFNCVRPDRAYFGEKDFQQLTIIKKMVFDLNLAVTIESIPTAREKSGLALSSRNQYLSSEEKKLAPTLFASLSDAVSQFNKGENNPKELKKLIQSQLADFKLDYVVIVDQKTLKEVKTVAAGNQILIAAWLGKTRLIDNIRVT